MDAPRGRGPHTCARGSFVDCHPVLRRHLAVADDRVVVCGPANGCVDEDHRPGAHRPTREPVASFTTFSADVPHVPADQVRERRTR
jgi:hypothetical protein